MLHSNYVDVFVIKFGLSKIDIEKKIIINRNKNFEKIRLYLKDLERNYYNRI